MEIVQKYRKTILTTYELYPVGEYGLDAVEKNYEEMFSDTNVGIVLHNLDMMIR